MALGFNLYTIVLALLALGVVGSALGAALSRQPGKRALLTLQTVGILPLFGLAAVAGVAEDINWHSFFFVLFGAQAAGFAVAVVLTNNVVRMAFFLILSLAATAALFFLAGADFVGAMQLMIYVGGTLVLLVFGVMLTAQGPFVSMKTKGGDWILAALVAGILLAFLAPAAWSVAAWRNESATRESSAAVAQQLAEEGSAAELGLGLVGVRSELLTGNESERRPGMAGYLLPFEIVSVHLLVVLIGAAYLARAKRRASRAADRCV